MKLEITPEVLADIHAYGEDSYPEEGAGLLLGTANGNSRVVTSILKLTNSREDGARHNRFLITAQDMMRGENEAIKQGLAIIGVFHSHPDHPNQPSEFDREWAVPWYSYIITSIQGGKAAGSRSWRLTDDRGAFEKEEIQVTSDQ